MVLCSSFGSRGLTTMIESLRVVLEVLSWSTDLTVMNAFCTFFCKTLNRYYQQSISCDDIRASN
jgi:hypothetical protein